MSLQTLKEIKCACGDTFETEIYQSVSVGEDPELKDLILGGEFNMVECPHCHQVIYAENFVLYHDHAQELMAFVYPYAMKENQGPMAEQMKATFSELQSKLADDEKLTYGPLMLFGMDQLCDVLKIDDDLTDESDVAEYVCKSLGMKAIKLPKAFARVKGIPYILPLGEKGERSRQSMITGLEKLLKENDRLSLYQKLLEQIKADPDWKV